MGRLVAGVMLLTLSLTPIIASLLFLFQQWESREAMERQIKTARLQQVHMAVKDLRWLSEGKELRVNGHLFDVEDYSIQNGVATLTGLYDDREEELYRDLDLMTSRDKDQNSRCLMVQSFLTQTLDFHEGVVAISEVPDLPHVLHPSAGNIHHPSHHPQLPTPPPWVVFS